MLEYKSPWARAHLKTSAGAWLALAVISILCTPRLSAQQLPAVIGTIEGDNIEVKTPVGAGIESHFAPTVVASGSEVTLSDGNGLILLDGGGEISLCGPAHFTMFKSGEAVTLALDYGRVHPSIDASKSLTIFTPIVVATPIAISGARRNSTIGLDQHGAMCILTDQGAMRIQQQLSDQSLVIPQGGVVSLVDGQVESLHADISSCSCEYTRPAAVVTTPAPQEEVAVLTPPLAPERRQPDAEPVPPSAETPVYTVTLPPLSFDASSPVPPPDPSPESMLLVREVRMQPEAEFHGRVDPGIITAALHTSADPIPSVTQPREEAKNPQKQSGGGFMARLRNFFRGHANHPPCEGSGCSK